MNTESIVKPEVSLIGVAVRTTNAEEAGPSGRLAALWDTYFASGIAEQIGASNAHLIYALYTDYESDASGAYTVLIGHERGDNATLQVPTGMEQALIPESKFIVFKTRKGPVYEVVLEAWGEIWAFFEHSSIERAYTGDYELYDGRSFNPADAEVDIHIAIK
ncbi:AraC family transcriptional regulator [Paenibacillus sp. FSL H8-0548]|uniref:GyrI-like domain-containing protein n=1 Tax=Paenibacillus sp. FSL H8-0548 TaxID=1920422 RepID=UPI00096E5BCC|nr:effector binding domain-containing protein [Paenibacillus sp. FSL H8-0548]OMF37311.1 AraC family transcriptional regulator [Paenibacillus sp. FSL H8-0548]